MRAAFANHGMIGPQFVSSSTADHRSSPAGVGIGEQGLVASRARPLPSVEHNVGVEPGRADDEPMGAGRRSVIGDDTSRITSFFDRDRAPW